MIVLLKLGFPDLVCFHIFGVCVSGGGVGDIGCVLEWGGVESGYDLTLIYPAHFEDVPCQSGVNHIFEG